MEAKDLNYLDFPPEKIKAYKKKGRWYVELEGLEPLSAAGMAKFFVMNITSTRRLLRETVKDDGKYLAKWIGDKIYLRSMGYSVSLRVFDLEDGKKACVIDIMDNVQISNSAANRRLNFYDSGLITVDELFRKRTPRAIAMAAGVKKKKAKKKKDYIYPGPSPIEGMQPRKKITDLKPPGTWESKNLSPGSISIKKSGVACHADI